MAGDCTAESTKTFSLQVGAATSRKNQIAVAVNSMDADTLDLGTTSTGAAFSANAAGSTGTVSTANGIYTSAAGNAIAKIKVEDFTFSTAATDADDAVDKKRQNTALAAAINASSEMKARGITATVAADAAGLMTLAFTSGSALHMDDQAHAKAAIRLISTAIKTVNTQRFELGAVSNHLSHTVANMTSISTKLSAAKGSIEHADFALETTNLAKNKILQQTSTAMLARANTAKQNMLSLPQG